MREVEISQFLTEGQADQVADIWNNDRAHFHQRVLDEVILPNMAEIDRKLGQENDPRYLAYAIEAVLMQAVRRDS